MNSINIRPDLSRHLAQRLQAFREGFRQNQAIIGHQGSGKSFQLAQFVERSQQETPVIYCPLYRESCRSFIQRFIAAILQAGPADKTLLPKTAAVLEPIDSLLRRRLHAEAFNRALDAVPVMFAERGLPGVLILDEFLLLEEMGLGHTFHELGKRVMTWPNCWFVLASSSPYRARLILRERLQLLFGQFELVQLGPLNAPATGLWIEQLVGDIEDREGVSDFLMYWLESSPWYLNVWLKRIKEMSQLQGHKRLTESLCFQVAWDLLGDNEGVLHQWCASRLAGIAQSRQGGRTIEVLIHLASGARTATELSRHVGRSGLSAALQELVEKDLVQRNGTCWVVPDPVLRCWLSTVLRQQYFGTVAGAWDSKAEMQRYLQQLWLRWLTTRQVPLWQQMQSLFAKFSDDTVCLDSKTGKLPNFTHVQPVDAPPKAKYLVAEGGGRRWVAAVQERAVDERLIAEFDSFCRSQTPKPSRKILITKTALDDHARVIAKTANMWVWQAEELELLTRLYDQEPHAW